MEKYQIMGELNKCISEFCDGKKTRKDVEAKIAHFETHYGFDGGDEFIRKLDRIEALRNEREGNNNELDNKIDNEKIVKEIKEEEEEEEEETNNKMTLEELYTNYIDKYTIDKITKREAMKGIKQYEKENGCSAPPHVYNRVENISQQRKVVWISIIIIAAILLGVFMIGKWIFSGINSGPDYTTYYDDENGNGELDKGEWNWTEDENGNTVDVDNDGSNF